MLNKLTFRKRLFLYLFSVFILFTIIIILFQYSREKNYRVNQLDNTLDFITHTCNNYINSNRLFENNSLFLIDSLIQIIPQQDIRITLINSHGLVLFDSSVEDYSLMENHFYRPEIQESLYNNYGTRIRESTTTGKKYYYYSRHFNDYFIRVAVVYDIQIKNLLKAEHVFLLFIVAIFIIIGIILDLVTKKFGESIKKLKDFVIKVRRDEDFKTINNFPKDELGDISYEIIQLYNNLKRTKDSLTLESEKLLNHLYVLNEGVAFFSKNKTKILNNNHFIRYINIIANTLSAAANDFFRIPEFEEINNFVDENIEQNSSGLFPTNPTKSVIINKSGKFFKIQCIIFNDKSFEILITDQTKLEKNRIIKQQMTSNISHELKTPITSIKGYIETIISDPDMEPDQLRYFLERANSQATRLTDLINDIVILNKIEETGDFFAFANLNINELIFDIIDDYQNLIKQNEIIIKVNLEDSIHVHGNRSLIQSIFRNLLENAIKYSGKGSEIVIKIYRKDESFYYFSLSDSGVGIPEQHLSRIFERFYRIGSDRSRILGGTGLGLAIVKNAVMLHKGEISVKNKNEGGIEFLFSLPKQK